jgi:glycosyltransferase involved in cell wall biosynthesis
MTKQTAKVLVIGNYPPPMCGWAIQTKLVVEEVRRRGYVCEVLKINENRQMKSAEYIDVQNGLDYLIKITRYALRGFRLNVHVNGMSKKGYWLALAVAVVGRLAQRPVLLTFHGGLEQMYFPRNDRSVIQAAFYLLFQLASETACDSNDIKPAIEQYGVSPRKVRAIATFSPQYMHFERVPLPESVENFLGRRRPVIFSYLSFRPEYRLEVMRDAMLQYRKVYPQAGLVWLGFPGKEFVLAEEYVRSWPEAEREGLLLLGNLSHDQFLTLLTRSSINLRTPACDGVSASVLESLTLGIPVVASENGRRPQGVLCYQDTDARDMFAKMVYCTEHLEELRSSLRPIWPTPAGRDEEDNVARMADWMAGETSAGNCSQVPAF